MTTLLPQSDMGKAAARFALGWLTGCLCAVATGLAAAVVRWAL